ncbi:MAG: DUF1947 domain-containing protein [Nanoarchaeota archaeon]
MRRQLSKNDKEAINAALATRFGVEEFLQKKQPAELVEEDGLKYITIEGVPTLFYGADGSVYPTLKLLLKHQLLPAIPVDMGAVKFVTSGADVMRPGIKAIDVTLKKDQLVCVVDEKHNKPLAVGIMLMSGEDATKATSGKTVKNVHWIGDKMWQK